MAGEKLKTPVGIASYPHLFEAVAGEDGGKPKFSIAIVFDEAAQATPEFKAMKAEALRLGVAKWGQKFESMVLSDELKWPFKKDKKNKYPDVKNAVIMNFRSDTPPGVVSRRKGPDGKPTIITKEMQSAGNQDEVYPGSKVIAVISGFVYDKSVNKGVSFGLNNVQKVGEGTRIDGRKAAQDDFDADLTEEPASLDDLVGGGSAASSLL